MLWCSLLFCNYHNCFVFIVEELNLTEPGNKSLDRKIAQLDRIFDECKFTVLLNKSDIVKKLENSSVDSGTGDDGKNVNASQARLDIVAFSKLAAINHQRIRRVAASSWTFRATDFANRIVRLILRFKIPFKT